MNCISNIKQLHLLLEYIESHNFSGYDPYDALNSPIARVFPFNQKLLRIAFIQFLLRFPINLRPLLGIQPGHNPKALGLFLDGYTNLYKVTQTEELKQHAQVIVELLYKYKAQRCSGNAWGYNFDWQNRVFFIPKFTPTIVNSSFIGHALLDAWQAMRMQQALDLALPIKDFIIRDINRLVENDSICFSYTPLDYYAVHNANLLGASLLYRIGEYLNDAEAKQIALSALLYSMNYQGNDGAWKYSEQHSSNWIDSFHTGFNLESIRWFLRLDKTNQYANAYQKGVDYYAKAFFLDDGTPKYYDQSVYPIDIHCPAEGLSFFSQEGQRYSSLSDKIVTWMMKNLFSEAGYFYFRKNLYFTNKIPYMRWSQAWAFRGLSRYVLSKNAKKTQSLPS